MMDLWLPPKPAIIMPAPKQANFLPGWFPGGGIAGRTPFDISYTATSDQGASTTYTFTSLAIGNPDSLRAIFVGVTGANGGTVNSVTVGGISATQVVANTGTNFSLALWVAVVPTGTTANVVVTFAAGQARCAVQIVRMVGYNSLTPTDTDAPAGGGDASRTITIDAPANGGVMSFACGRGGAIGVTNTTLLNATTTGGSDNVACAAYITVGSAEANRVITHNPCRANLGAAYT